MRPQMHLLLHLLLHRQMRRLLHLLLRLQQVCMYCCASCCAEAQAHDKYVNEHSKHVSGARRHQPHPITEDQMAGRLEDLNAELHSFFVDNG